MFGALKDLPDSRDYDFIKPRLATATPVLETGGNLIIGEITLSFARILPLTSSEEEFQSFPKSLASEMSENPFFYQLVEQGLQDLRDNYYKPFAKMRSR